MFSVQVTSAVSPVTETCTSVRKNWMYSVFAMISAYDLRTSPRPVSTGQPGCTQEITPLSAGSWYSSSTPRSAGVSQSEDSSSKSPRSRVS